MEGITLFRRVALPALLLLMLSLCSPVNGELLHSGRVTKERPGRHASITTHKETVEEPENKRKLGKKSGGDDDEGDGGGCIKCIAPDALDEGSVRRLKDDHQGEEMISEKCKNEEEYRLSLFVSNHIFMFATPATAEDHGDGAVPECPSLVFHDPLHKTGEIAKLVVDKLEQWENEGLPLRHLKLAEVLEAVEVVSLYKRQKHTLSFEIVHNNCATFILDALELLGIEVDDRIMSYTSEKLHESGVRGSGSSIIKLLRSSPYLPHLSEDAHELEDKVLLDLLVQNYVKEHKETM